MMRTCRRRFNAVETANRVPLYFRARRSVRETDTFCLLYLVVSAASIMRVRAFIMGGPARAPIISHFCAATPRAYA